jgi:hypothetical protein
LVDLAPVIRSGCSVGRRSDEWMTEDDTGAQ